MNNPSQTKESILALLNDLSADTRKALYDLCVAKKQHLIFGDGLRREAVPLEALKEIFQQ